MSIVQDTSIYRFGDFTLDPANRELLYGEERLNLNARYFDALVLLVREHGRLVEKDRFFENVWDDVVVSDSALTQCIKDIRRQLGDDAANPRFIQTVPRHGYRFIAEVSIADRSAAPDAPAALTGDSPSQLDEGNAASGLDEGNAASRLDEGHTPSPLNEGRTRSQVDAETARSGFDAEDARSRFDKGNARSRSDRANVPSQLDAGSAPFRLDAGNASISAQSDRSSFAARLADRTESAFSSAMVLTLAATLGGAAAGLIGGLLYGFGLAYSPVDQEIGTASLLLVLISLAVFLGTVGGFGIGAGMAAGEVASGGRSAWRIVGAVLGGMLIGGSAKLLGVDAFNLFFGRTPAGITGGMEGAALGLAVGLGAHVGGGIDAPARWRPIAAAAATGAVVGVAIALLGGHLLAGSLDLLARSFSESRLQLDAFGRYFGEVRFGQTTQVVLAGIEGLIFVGCVVGALVASQRSRTAPAEGRNP